jgi:prepilin signal peptidase PulO-like enzyme (type II secretory pathway)
MWIFSMVLWLFISILFGLIFWSFWSVILSRRAKSQSLEQSLSIIFWRSECPNCKTTLQAIDLIPLFSFLFQGWRCRYCKKKISWFYPILELWSAIIFWFAWWYLSGQWTAIALFWMMTWWILWLMVVHSVLWYEIHMPLLFVWFAALIIAIRNWLFQRDVLWWWVALFIVFLVLYFMAKWVVRIRYHVKEDWLWIWDILMSPYLWTLLFAWLWAWFWTLDRILAILYFLIFSGIVWIIWYYLQTKQQTKRAYRFLNAKIANQSLPLLPSMVISMFIIILFKETLFSLVIF